MFSKIRVSTIPALLAALALAAPAAAQKQDPNPPTREQVISLLEEALPPILDDDNSDVAAKLLRPILGDPPSKSFDRQRAIRAIFGRLAPSFAPDCKRLATPAGELDPNECLASRGSLAGGGAFTGLEFSKHPGFGNFNFFRRAADGSVTPASLVPVKLSPADAHKGALDFLTMVFGLSPLEMPTGPATAMPPVKTLFQAWAGGPAGSRAPLGAVGVEQHVFVQRGARVDLSDELRFVPLPGRAVVRLTDAGVQGALVKGWGDVMPDPKADPSLAKSRRRLVDEMADEILQDIHAPIASLKARIQLEGIPDGRSHLLLLPAVQLTLSPVPDDLAEEQQGSQWTTAGVIQSFMLLGSPDAKQDEDD